MNVNSREPVSLPSEILQEIFYVIRSCFFNRLPNFDVVVGKQLLQLLSDSNNFVINEETTKTSISKYYDLSIFVKNDQKTLLSILKLIFKATFVLIISCYEANRALVWGSVSRLQSEYGSLIEFQKLDAREWNYLLNYRNAVKIAQIIIPAKNNKGSLLMIAGSLEGSRSEYVTGGRFLFIYFFLTMF
jgi:hypothetical protein